MRKHALQVVSRWNDFWFTPQETSSVGLYRIAFGLLATVWTLTLGPNLFAFFGSGGVLPERLPGIVNAISVLSLTSNSAFLVLVYGVTLAACLALTAGFHSRLAGWLVFLGMLSFQHRNPMILNAGDSLVRCLALLCALAPSGVALSVDRLRSAPGRFWEFPARSPWALRLVQILISLGYLTAVWDKMQGAPWRNGTAVAYALRVLDIQRVPAPAFFSSSSVISEAMTFGTLALEASLGIFVWNRVLRPYVLLLGVFLHASIEVSMTVGFFSLAMFAAYVTFIPPETATRVLLRGRELYNRRRGTETMRRPVVSPADA